MVWMAIVAAALVVGFGLDASSYMAERPAPPPILHLNALVYVVWIGLVATQILLIQRGNVRLHKTLGWATAVVAGVMVRLGLTGPW